MKTLILIIISAGLLCAVQASAQKATSQWLPESVKIDGKLTEWIDGLKAYNKATRVEYLLANDVDRLYIAIKSKDVSTTSKILAGGITFTINTQGKKKATGPSITFPLTNSGYTKVSSGINAISYTTNFMILRDSGQVKSAIGRLKEIKVLNFKGIIDTIQSIYNEYDIKTSIKYIKAGLILEVLIPRSLLALDNKLDLFSFQVLLKGVPAPPLINGATLPPGPPPGRAPSSESYINAEMRSATDFWGEYTLAKKP